MRSNGRRSRTADPMELLRADLAALRKDFASLTSNGVHKVVDKVVDKASGSYDDVASSVKEFSDEAQDRAREAHKRLAEVASERPITTIAIAVAAGALGAKLMQWMDRD